MSRDQQQEMVEISHPDSEGTATVPRTAFDEHWSEKGWVLAGGEESETPPAEVEQDLFDETNDDEEDQ